jgi:hypothetical protein
MVAERLAELYPAENAARRVLALAGIDSRRVALAGPAADRWWAAVVEAQHQGKLMALVELALEEYPLDEWLWAAHTQLRRLTAEPQTGRLTADGWLLTRVRSQPSAVAKEVGDDDVS